MIGPGRPVFVWLAALLIWFWPAALLSQEPIDNCAVCHLAIGVENLTKPAQQYKEDIHAAKGFGCIACHGGDATIMGLESMDPKKGYIGKPEGAQLVAVCGRCHSDQAFMRRYNPNLRVDQVAEYYTSVHGKRLREQKDTKVATCTSCHYAHSIRPPNDKRSSVHPLRVAATCGTCHANAEYMAPYKLAIDQLSKYRKSVHWQAIAKRGDYSAPTCNDCHSNHGAAPQGISWVGNACAQCHPVNSELYNKSVHGQIFTLMGAPGCRPSHGNHDILPASEIMLDHGSGAVCTSCHPQGSQGAKLASGMHETLVSLSNDYEKARKVLADAEHAGMEISQAQFELAAAKTALLKARAAIHSFSLEAVEKEAAPGLKIAQTAYQQGVSALQELQFRRKGLAFSSLIILALIVGLVIKIRDIDKKS